MKLLRKFNVLEEDIVNLSEFDELKNYEKFLISWNPLNVFDAIYLRANGEYEFLNTNEIKLSKEHIINYNFNLICNNKEILFNLNMMNLINISDKIICVKIYGF